MIITNISTLKYYLSINSYSQAKVNCLDDLFGLANLVLFQQQASYRKRKLNKLAFQGT